MPSLLASILFSAVSCRKDSDFPMETPPEHGIGGHCTLTLDCNGAAAAGQDELRMNSGYILFFSEDGNLRLRHRLDEFETASGKVETDIQAGNYRIWGIFNCEEIEQAVTSCSNLEEFRNLSIPFHCQKPGNFTACLNAYGTDAVVSVPERGRLSIYLKGSPSVAKITFQQISNRLGEESAPETDSDYSFICQEILLGNAPGQVSVGGATGGKTWNFTEERTRNLESESVLAHVGSVVPQGSTARIMRSLYCFPVGQDSPPVTLSVICRKAASMEYYNIPIGRVKAGNEYIISNLYVYKNGAHDFWTPTSSEFCGTRLSVRTWHCSEGTDFIQTNGDGVMICSVSDTELFLGTKQHCSEICFDRIYGHARVTSSDETVVKAIGAGRFWTLFPVAKGSVTVLMDDGCSTDSCTVTVDESIKGFWSFPDSSAECDTGTELHSYQSLRFNLTQWHGSLSLTGIHSFSPSGTSHLTDGYSDFYCTGENSPYIILTDRYGDRLFGWDGPVVSNWWNDRIPSEWIDGPVEKDMTLDNSKSLRFRLQAPFALDQLSVPVTVSFDNDMGFSCRQTIAGQYLYLTVSCDAEENGTSAMRIGIGDMSRKIKISYRFTAL